MDWINFDKLAHITRFIGDIVERIDRTPTNADRSRVDPFDIEIRMLRKALGPTIQCDGYSAYIALAARFKTIRLGGCLAHVRRKFVEAKGLSPEITLPALLFIQRIYQIETQIRQTQAPPACRELIRSARSRPITDEFFTLIHTARKAQLPHDSLGEALTYTINQQEKILVCLENGRLEIDNNLAENKVRPVKL